MLYSERMRMQEFDPASLSPLVCIRMLSVRQKAV